MQEIKFDHPLSHDGFVIPYGETPTMRQEVAKTVYASMINSASRYVHIMTPYFIVDREFLDVMRYAAERGVEVAMILPGIPPRWERSTWITGAFTTILSAAHISMRIRWWQRWRRTSRIPC